MRDYGNRQKSRGILYISAFPFEENGWKAVYKRLRKRISVNKRSFRFDHARKNRKLRDISDTIKESAWG